MRKEVAKNLSLSLDLDPDEKNLKGLLQKLWKTVPQMFPPLFQPLTREGWEVTDIWLYCVVAPHFHPVWPGNVGETGQLFLIYLLRQILAYWAALHSLAEVCVLIIDSLHILSLPWALSQDIQFFPPSFFFILLGVCSAWLTLRGISFSFCFFLVM